MAILFGCGYDLCQELPLCNAMNGDVWYEAVAYIVVEAHGLVDAQAFVVECDGFWDVAWSSVVFDDEGGDACYAEQVCCCQAGWSGSDNQDWDGFIYLTPMINGRVLVMGSWFWWFVHELHFLDGDYHVHAADAAPANQDD